MLALIVGALYFVGRNQDEEPSGEETPAPMETRTQSSEEGPSEEERREMNEAIAAELGVPPVPYEEAR